MNMNENRRKEATYSQKSGGTIPASALAPFVLPSD